MQRVTGPDYMLKTIALGLSQGWRHYFYGSTPETLVKMEKALREKYPAIQIAGMYNPPFRALSAEEDGAIVEKSTRPPRILSGLAWVPQAGNLDARPPGACARPDGGRGCCL